MQHQQRKPPSLRTLLPLRRLLLLRKPRLQKRLLQKRLLQKKPLSLKKLPLKKYLLLTRRLLMTLRQSRLSSNA
jgi:hypothetical protein